MHNTISTHRTNPNEEQVIPPRRQLIIIRLLYGILTGQRKLRHVIVHVL